MPIPFSIIAFGFWGFFAGSLESAYLPILRGHRETYVGQEEIRLGYGPLMIGCGREQLITSRVHLHQQLVELSRL